MAHELTIREDGFIGSTNTHNPGTLTAESF